MVTLKTKYEKHANDNEKRRQSIKEREKAKSNQSQIIKNALSNSLSSSSSKKIVFSDEENEDAGGTESSVKNFNGNKKPALFESSESENEDFEIKEKTQFSGKKGFELLNLQSTYGNDERFKIDERFLEDEKDDLNGDQNDSQNDVGNVSEEKAKQLKILGNILGTSDAELEKGKKGKKRTYEMIRYDASNKDHEIYEIKTQPTAESSFTSIKEASKKLRKERKRRRSPVEDAPKPKVSKEKFYEVSNEIKDSFKKKSEDAGQFSLLQTYGLNNGENDGEIGDNEIDSEDLGDGDFDIHMNEVNFEISSKQSINKENETEKDEQKGNENGAVAKGIWKEPFFFVENDERLKEGLEFINKKNSLEAREAIENYHNSRRKLKEILRLHLKKQMSRKNPFKSKVGGMSKKQLVNSKYKNSKKFNKKKPLKRSPHKKT